MTTQTPALSPLESFNQDGQTVTFEFGSARLLVSVLESGLLRVRYAPTGQFGLRRSWAVAKDDRAYAGATYETAEDDQFVILKTDQISLRVRRADGGVEFGTADGQTLMADAPDQGPHFGPDGKIVSLKAIPNDEYYYGFGERTGLLEKRGYRYTCWNQDPVDQNLDHGPGTDNMYQSIPFFMAVRPTVACYGLFFNNTFKTTFDVGYSQTDRLSLEADGGELDYYLLFGPTPAQVVERYTDLTGRTPLPPRWSLGYHQSRWSYFPADRVREIVRGFRDRKIPGEVIHLDIDYMNGYRVFSWDKERFPDPAGLCQELEAEGFKVVTIIDPGVKYEPGGYYEVYNEGVEKGYFIRKNDGELFVGYVWPDDSVFPDFAQAQVRQWWGDLHQKLLDVGVRGIWNDMNEPSISSVPFGEWGLHVQIPAETTQGDPDEPTTHAEIHNVYGYLEDMATHQALRRNRPDRRPFVLTRAGYAGIQRWSAVWTGDNSSVWEHLEMTMPQLCNLGLSGVGFAGVDIGGFWGSSKPELWARWIQLGAFSPFARGHAAMGTPAKEPWEWGETVETIARRYLELRYQLLPYLYTAFEENSRTGAPIMRPLFYHFWQDKRTLQINDQVMVGEAFMLAPVYRPGQEMRLVYLPGGANWYEFWSGEGLEGSYLLASVPLETLPVFVRGGSVVPFGPIMQYSDERPLDALTLEVYLDRDGQAQGQLYEDAGDGYEYEGGQSCRTTYTVTTDPAGVAHLTTRRIGQYQPAARSVEIRLHRPARPLKTISLATDEGDWEVQL